MKVFRTLTALFFAASPGAVGIVGGYLAAHGATPDVSWTWVALATTAAIILVVLGLNVAYDTGRRDRADDAAELGSW